MDRLDPVSTPDSDESLDRGQTAPPPAPDDIVIPSQEAESPAATAAPVEAAAASPDPKAEANAAQAAGRFEEAERRWRDYLASNPDEAEAMCGLAVCLFSLGRHNEADLYVRRVLAAPVVHLHARTRLGTKLVEMHRQDDAIAMFRSVATGFPDHGDTWNHLGAAELGGKRAAAALASFRRASRLQPTSAAVWCNMALALLDLDRLPDALAASQRALAIEPASPTATFNMSAVLLSMGRLKAGFAAYEHRFALGGRGWLRHDVGALPWTGEPLAGRSILVVGEQANGDQLQFCRYAPELARRGAKVTYMLPKRLHRLMRSLGEDIALIETPEAGTRYDFQVPLLSLPHRCSGEDGRAPAATPYLRAEASRVAAWRERIGVSGFRIAVAWEGFRHAGGRDLNRSYPVEALWPLAQIPGVRLISLQLKDGLDQLSRLPPGMAVETLGPDYDAGEHAFLDAAAVMMNADLVVSLDSGMAHLAGALACPTWVALPFAPEWRWQRGRSDCPWYPTMRLWRQGVLGDWDGVFERMAEALAPVVAAHTPPEAPAPALPRVPASFGEVFDKISILEIKVDRLEAGAAAQAAFELRHLQASLDENGISADAVKPSLDDLRRVNRALWDVEDRLRSHEADARFDDDFIALARSVYRLNDERAAIKRRINIALKSAIVEQKSYGRVAGADAD